MAAALRALFAFAGAGILLVLLAYAALAPDRVVPKATVSSCDPDSAAVARAGDTPRRIRAMVRDGWYLEARQLARDWLSVLEVAGCAESLRWLEATRLWLEVLVHTEMGCLPEVRESTRQTVRSAYRIAGPESLTYAWSLRHLGLIESCDPPDEGRPLLERSLSLFERLQGPDHPDVAYTLGLLAWVEQLSGRYPRARALYERAEGILERARGPDDQDRAVLLMRLAAVQLVSGDYDGAQALLRRTLDIQERVLRPGHPDIGNTLLVMGNLEWQLGAYARARALYEQSLAIHEAVFGPGHAKLGSGMNNLALVLNILGDYAAARRILEQGLQQQEELGISDSSSVQNGRSNLATALAGLGEYAAAEQLLRRVLEIRERVLPPDHELTGSTLHQLGRILRKRGERRGARSLQERALWVYDSNFGPYHERVADALMELGGLSADEGDLAAADGSYRMALEIRERILGAEHPDTATTRVEIALGAWRRGDRRSAIRAALRAEAHLRGHLRDTARGLPERLALRYEVVRESGQDLALSALVESVEEDDPESDPRIVFDTVIRSRALVLDEITARHRSVLDSDTERIRELTRQLDRARSRLGGLVSGGPSSKGNADYAGEVRAARAGMEALERELAEADLVFMGARIRDRVGLTQVEQSLPPGAAIVSYVRYGRVPAPGRPDEPPVDHYLAFSWSPPGSVRVVGLGPAAEIDRLVLGWRDEAGTAPDGPAAVARCREAGRALRRAVWDPVIGPIGAAKLVLVVPDGALHLVDFGALPSPSGVDRYLLEEAAILHYLSSERDLVQDPQLRKQGRGILIVGGPDYDASNGHGSPVLADAAFAVRGTVAVSPVSSRCEGGPDCAGSGMPRFPALPSARFEAEEVAMLWRGVSDDRADVIMLVGEDATEAAVRLNGGGRRIIHVATHGFFLINGEWSEDDRSLQGAADDPSVVLSGLALAGANLPGGGPQSAPFSQDGLLTTEEIASLDLRSVEWVVLSSCSSGVGPIQNREGVLGLRRAFAIAGAGSLILSLWPIEDHAAREWVKALYRARLSGISTAASVRRATIERLESQRRSGFGTHPFTWGAFVAAGDWR